MAFKARHWHLMTLAALIVGTGFTWDAAQKQLWANMALGILVMVGCLVMALQHKSPVLQDPPAFRPDKLPGGDPLAALLDQVAIPLFKFSPEMGMQAVNLAARSLFRTDDLVVNVPDNLYQVVMNAELGSRHSVVLFGRTYAIAISEITTAHEKLRLVSLTDIQPEIRIAEATALRDLLRVLSHEIMNSLTPVASLADVARSYLIDENTPASKAALKALDVLAKRADSLSRFIEAYRALARLPDPALRSVDVGTLIQDIVQVFRQSPLASNISIRIDIQKHCPRFDLDETLMAQALLNILSNAAEATIGMPVAGQIQVSMECDSDEARILISDNGGGIPEPLAGQIFHAFVTTKANGTGTGLNLARQIALAHGGDLIFMGARAPAWSTVFCFIVRTSPRTLRI
ncbi:ATP-binding protein [Asticcacaulis sp. SL142]|uniref:sensor histidine kinase n=1 Tax=Asticcacaulis sp. SL142 TaxID=2995155 RepID=UPI00226CFC68|nr:ATP-binding protein [Asticcacaulis sp. SL142]WAC46853.1 ATP-binding protein [Asticcacaulis sp. SL142]